MIEDETARELTSHIQRDVSAGFLSPNEIAEMAIDLTVDGDASEELRALAERVTDELLEKHLAMQSSWPEITDCDLLDAAFKTLNERGIVSRQNFSCCQNCGSYEIGDEMLAARDKGGTVRGYTYYHLQDTESAVEGYGLYLAYGSIDGSAPSNLQVGREVVDTLIENGLNPNWDGDLKSRIKIPLDWKKRR